MENQTERQCRRRSHPKQRKPQYRQVLKDSQLSRRRRDGNPCLQDDQQHYRCQEGCLNMKRPQNQIIHHNAAYPETESRNR